MVAAFCMLPTYQTQTVFNIGGIIFTVPVLHNSKQQVGWDDNIDGLERLGFRVVVIDCTDQVYINSPSSAKNDILNTIGNLSGNRSLHGLYLVAHGVSDGLRFAVQVPGLNGNGVATDFITYAPD